MTNNMEDFEQPGLEPNGGLPPPGGVRANLSHAWRTRPLFKLLVLMIIAGAILVVGLSLFSSTKPGEISKLSAPPTGMKQAPGGPASPYFIDQTKKAEEERESTALKTGGSVLPTPVGPNTSIDDMTAQKQKVDPLVELRTQLDLQKQKIAQMEQKPQPAPAKPETFDDSLAQAMQKQMRQLEDDWEPKGIRAVSGAKDDSTKLASTATGSSSAGASGSDASMAGGGTSTVDTSQSKKFATPILNAGTVSYAQLLTEANSDVPGPILAQIMSGPLSGARAVGEFKVSNELLVLRFSLANLKGIDYKIDALALDPDTTLGGMATEVDERWLTRVLLPAAAGFIQGFGQALGQPPTTVTSSGDTTIITQSGRSVTQGIYTGIGQAGQSMSEFFQNQANQTQTLVRVAAGTPIGLFFTATVCSGQGCPLPEVEDRQSRGYFGGNNQGGGYQGQGGYGSNGSQQGGYGGYNNGYSNGYNNGSQPGGYNPGGPMTGYNNSAFSGTGITYNNNNSTSTPAPSSTPSLPYNTTNPPTPVSQQNTGINVLSPGLGTSVLNP